MCLKVALCVFLALWCAIASATAKPIVLDYDEDYISDPYEADLDYKFNDAYNGRYAIVYLSGQEGNSGYQWQQETYPQDCKGAHESEPCAPGPTPDHPTHRPHPSHHSPYPYPAYSYPYAYPAYPYPIYREPPVRRTASKRLCVKVPGLGLLCGPSVRFS